MSFLLGFNVVGWLAFDVEAATFAE